MRVLVFGSFDPLHEGHRSLFRQASKLGELLVVVARDSYIRAEKGKEPRQGEAERLKAVEQIPEVEEAISGDEWPSEEPYRLLKDLEFDVLALGYDQKPADEAVADELIKLGKGKVKIVRLKPYKPSIYKSSYV